MIKNTLYIAMCITCLAAIAAVDAVCEAGAQGGGTVVIAVTSVVTNESEILTEEEIRAITAELEGRTVGIDELQGAVDRGVDISLVCLVRCWKVFCIQ